MVRFIRTAAVLGAVAAFVVCAAPAPAAKGVKKNGAQQVSGRVVAMHHGKNGQGTITIQVMHQKQQKGLVAGQAARRQRGQTRTFTVTQATRVQGGGNGRGGLAGLRTGTHVTIAAHQGQADTIMVGQLGNRNKVAKR